MKYLKRFNESSTDKVIEHLQDICRELQDIFFKVDIFYHGRNGVEYVIDVSQDNRLNWWSSDNETRNNEMFLYGSVEDHFNNYMKDLGYTMKVNYNLPVETPHHITYNFYKKSFNESKQDKLRDIEDIFLELKDDGWKVVHEKFDVSSDYPFTNEFFIYKKGYRESEACYYLGDDKCELFNINDIIDDILRFCDVCEINGDKYRIITHDGQYTLDITKKINNLDEVDKSDVLEETHLHIKKISDIIDLDNVKFVSCQILK